MPHVTPALEASWETYESVGLKKVAVPGGLTTKMVLRFSLLESLGMPVGPYLPSEKSSSEVRSAYFNIYHRLCLNSTIHFNHTHLKCALIIV